MQFTSTLAILACIATACSAIDLNLWTGGGCSGAKVMCSNPGYAFCCTGGAPFCVSGNCDNCVVGNDIYTFNRAGCTGNSYASCRAAVGNGCCLSAGGGNTCAIVAYVGNARVAEVKAEECEASVRPNKMTYTSRNGTESTIHLPTGTFEKAAQYVIDEDWDALDKFPAWNGQKYTEADITRNTKKI